MCGVWWGRWGWGVGSPLWRLVAAVSSPPPKPFLDPIYDVEPVFEVRFDSK